MSLRIRSLLDDGALAVKVTEPRRFTVLTQYQRHSWLFATTNVLRIFVARKYKLESFQLSQVRQLAALVRVARLEVERKLTLLIILPAEQSYLYFMDHVSKANWFLEQMIDLIEEPLDSRTVQYLLASSEAQDGGQYDMAVALIEAYGLVPQSSASCGTFNFTRSEFETAC